MTVMIKEFTIGAAHTINLGHYESMRVEASVTVHVTNEDDLDQLRNNAQVELRSMLEETYKRQRRERKKNEQSSET